VSVQIQYTTCSERLRTVSSDWSLAGVALRTGSGGAAKDVHRTRQGRASSTAQFVVMEIRLPSLDRAVPAARKAEVYHSAGGARRWLHRLDRSPRV